MRGVPSIIACVGKVGRDLARTRMDMNIELLLLWSPPLTVVDLGVGDPGGKEEATAGVFSDIISATSTGCKYGSATSSLNLFS